MNSCRIIFGLAVALALLASPTQIFAQGRYEPVVEADVVRLDFMHFYTPDDEYREGDFTWKFRDGKFVMKAGEGEIPEYLRQKLLGKGVEADVIRGKWKLEEDEGGKLVLTGIKAGDHKGKKIVSFPIYRTAPTVVRIGQPQYVFAVQPEEEPK